MQEYKRLRLNPEDQALLLRALGCYLDTVPEPRGSNLENIDYDNFALRSKIKNLAWPIGVEHKGGGRRQPWGMNIVDSEWCNKRAKEIEAKNKA